MQDHKNALGQPIGAQIRDWTPRPRPPETAMAGRSCSMTPLRLDHAEDLHEAFSTDLENRIWTYLPYGPFASAGEVADWIAATCLGEDPQFHAILSGETGKALGVASYLRIEPSVGVIEVGHINFSPALQRSVMATEAMYLMMRRVFDELGYRRYEWKCDALNAPSLSAARRLGFTYEGTFRQATIYKGRNRDTAWFSVIDGEWPRLKTAFEAWLDPSNFDAAGRQLRSLLDLKAAS